MHAQNFPLPLLHSIIAFLCFLIMSSPSDGQENKQYSTCNRSYSCGNIQNISFPFWGGGRPHECGLPQFELKCEVNHDPIIDICACVTSFINYENECWVNCGQRWREWKKNLYGEKHKKKILKTNGVFGRKQNVFFISFLIFDQVKDNNVI